MPTKKTFASILNICPSFSLFSTRWRYGQVRTTEAHFVQEACERRFYAEALYINLAFDEHCCHIGTAIKHPVPDRVKPSIVIFDTQAL